MEGEGRAEARSAAAREAAGAPARRGGGVKGHSAAAGLAGGGGGGGGREWVTRCARVEKRRHSAAAGNTPAPSGDAGLRLTLAASVTRSAPFPRRGGRLVGVEWPELRARRAQGGNDNGVDIGGNNGLSRRGR